MNATTGCRALHRCSPVSPCSLSSQLVPRVHRVLLRCILDRHRRPRRTFVGNVVRGELTAVAFPRRGALPRRESRPHSSLPSASPCRTHSFLWHRQKTPWRTRQPRRDHARRSSASSASTRGGLISGRRSRSLPLNSSTEFLDQFIGASPNLVTLFLRESRTSEGGGSSSTSGERRVGWGDLQVG